MMRVSVVTPTRDRPALLAQAIKCFQSQTYPDLEMVILDNSQTITFTPPDDPRIRYIRLDGPVRVTGDMRNIACSIASGPLICNFDDDDWSAPTRIEKQVEQLLSSNKQVVGYHSIYFWSVEKRKAYLYRYADPSHSYASGATQLFYKSWWKGHPYTDKQAGSDTDFSHCADRAGVLKSYDNGGMLVATQQHGANTSRITLGSSNFPEIDTNRLPTEFLETTRNCVKENAEKSEQTISLPRVGQNP